MARMVGPFVDSASGECTVEGIGSALDRRLCISYPDSIERT